MGRPQNAVELLQDLVAIPSVNPAGQPGTDRVGEQALAEYVGDFLREIGAEVKLEAVAPGRPNVVASFAAASANAPRLAFMPHLDTVTVEGMTIPPFDPVVRDGRLHGRGASDTKGPMAAALWALREWAQSSARANSRVHWNFFAVMDEEAGNRGAQAIAESGFTSDLLLALEPTSLQVVTAHKGVLWMEILTTGVACHGATPELGRSAIHAMRQVLEVLEDELIPELRVSSHPKLGSCTVNVGTIHGGSKINIVPDSCRIEVDCRYLPGMEVDSVRAELEARLRVAASDIEVRVLRHAPPLDTSESLPWVRRLGEAARGFTTAPWFSDAAILAKPDCPAICIGPGSIAQAHTKDEFIALRDLEEGTEFFRRWIAAAESAA